MSTPTIDTHATPQGRTTHTPAPWKVEVWDYSHATPPRKELNIESSTHLLATVQCDHGENNPYVIAKAEAHANARLMSAAPELLAALVSAEGLIYEAQSDIPGEYRAKRDCLDALAIIRAAISKATTV